MVLEETIKVGFEKTGISTFDPMKALMIKFTHISENTYQSQNQIFIISNKVLKF